MSDSGLTTSQISAAGAYAQAERLVVTIPVRAIDPTRQRFQVEDQTSAQDAPAKTRSGTESTDGETSSSSQAQSGPSTGRGGFGLIGAVTSFLARMFGQGDTSQIAATTSVQDGVQAYVRAAGTIQAENHGTEILSPSFPRLASGRTVDLTV